MAFYIQIYFLPFCAFTIQKIRRAPVPVGETLWPRHTVRQSRIKFFTIFLQNAEQSSIPFRLINKSSIGSTQKMCIRGGNTLTFKTYTQDAMGHSITGHFLGDRSVFSGGALFYSPCSHSMDIGHSWPQQGAPDVLERLCRAYFILEALLSMEYIPDAPPSRPQQSVRREEFLSYAEKWGLKTEGLNIPMPPEQPAAKKKK